MVRTDSFRSTPAHGPVDGLVRYRRDPTPWVHCRSQRRTGPENTLSRGASPATLCGRGDAPGNIDVTRDAELGQ